VEDLTCPPLPLLENLASGLAVRRRTTQQIRRWTRISHRGGITA
jgi:hypothetical protein